MTSAKKSTERNKSSKVKAIICTEPGVELTEEDLDSVREYAQFRRFRRALENCYMLARRRRGTATGKDAEAWGHVIRICEEAGIEVNILRADRQRGPGAGA